MTSFSVDPKNDCLTERKLLEGFCRGTYPKQTVLIVNSDILRTATASQVYGNKLNLLNAIKIAAAANPYYMMFARLIPVVVDAVDSPTIDDLRLMVYNHIFVGLWWNGEFVFWQD